MKRTKKTRKKPTPFKRGVESTTFPSRAPKEGTSKDKKAVGGLIPRQLFDTLVLFTLCHDVTNILIIHQALANRLKKAMNNHGEMIDTIVKKAVANWNSMYALNEGRQGWRTDKNLIDRLDQFKQEMRKHLQKRKLSENYIEMIVSDFEKKVRL